MEWQLMGRSKSLSNRICHMNCPRIELVCAPDIQRHCTLQVAERGEQQCRLCCGGACIPYGLVEPKTKITIFYLKERTPGTRCIQGWTVPTAVHTHPHTHTHTHTHTTHTHTAHIILTHHTHTRTHTHTHTHNFILLGLLLFVY